MGGLRGDGTGRGLGRVVIGRQGQWDGLGRAGTGWGGLGRAKKGRIRGTGEIDPKC